MIDFDRDERRTAVKTFSKMHISLVLFTLIASLAIYALAFVAAIVLGEEGYVSFVNGPYFVWVAQVVCMYMIAFPIFLLMVRKLPSASREKSSMSFKEFIYIFFISEAIMLTGSMFSQWFTEVVGKELGAPIGKDLGATIGNPTANLISQSSIWIVILVVVIIGPIVEEFIFRKVMIDKLSVYGDRIAVLVSALAFGLFHGNFYQLFYATALGLVLGYMYTKTRRSIYNCLLHMAVNFMGTVPSLLLQDSINRLNEYDGTSEITDQLARDAALVNGYSSILSAILFAGIVIFIVATIKRSYRFSNECDIRVPVIHRPRVFLLNFGTLLFVLLQLSNCILSLFV